MKIKWSPFLFDPCQTFWLLIWNMFEYLGWGVCIKYAPFVFGKTVGCKKVETKKDIK